MTPTADRQAELARARRRTRAALLAGVALGSTGHIAAITVATIVAEELLGDRTLAGAPGAAVVLGAALGAILLSRRMATHGRRAGLVAGYATGAVGALVATLAVVTRSFPLLLAGTALVGFGNASNQLSRYVAADLVPPARRASALGLVVWSSTVGSVIGPNLAARAGPAATALGLPALAGPYLVPAAFVAVAGLLSFVLLRPDPYELADEAAIALEAEERAAAAGGGPLRAALGRPAVAGALAALVAGQFAMVVVMTMTPLHMTEHGHGLAAVGLVLSAHTLGMFALAPVSGWLTDRIGRIRTILLGIGVDVVAALLAALAPPDGGAVLLAALFLLGLGWNLGYVAGSALLSDSLELRERTRVQGVADALVWSAAAAASLGSGIVMAFAGYTTLGLLAAAAVVIAAVPLRRGARRPPEPAAGGARAVDAAPEPPVG